MSKEDIERAIKEAERYAEEDKKRREKQKSNGADQMVYQSEAVRITATSSPRTKRSR